MVDRLIDLGVPITWDDVAAIAGSAVVGRPHIARAMAASGAIASPDQAFTTDWIADGGRAYVDRYALEPTRAIGLVRAAGGVAVAQGGSGQTHKKATHHAVKHATRSHAAETTGADTDTIQSGDQTTPDAGSASASETSSSETSGEATASDGPGGHEDPGGTEADHQFEGEE